MKHRRPTLPRSFTHPEAGHCRWCGLPVLEGKPPVQTKRIRCWHPDCVTIYRIAMFSSDQRTHVFKRDKGICARCGTDCEAMRLRCFPGSGNRRRGGRWPGRFYGPPDWGTYYDRYGRTDAYQEPLRRATARWHAHWHPKLLRGLDNRRKRIAALGWRAFDREEGAWWQADHIRPLIESEGRLEFFLLSNLQTLCHRCHVEKGKEDNRRRKATRDPQLTIL